MGNGDEIKECARLFKSLSDETRLRLLKLLSDEGPEGALCVGALAMNLGVSQPAVSQHLAILRGAGLVVDERRGYFVHYRLNRARFDQCWEQVRATLGNVLLKPLAG